MSELNCNAGCIVRPKAATILDSLAVSLLCCPPSGHSFLTLWLLPTGLYIFFVDESAYAGARLRVPINHIRLIVSKPQRDYHLV